MRMSAFLRGLDDFLTRADPDVSGTASADIEYAEAMEAAGIRDGDAADEAYNRLQRIEEFHEARSIIHRPLP